MQPELVDALASEVVLTIKSALSPVLARLEMLERSPNGLLLERIAVLEHRVVVAEQMAAGKTGLNGKDGAPGRDGVDGKNGIDGKDGEPGVKGDPGVPGADGKGEKGDPGEDGKGEKGEPGEPGRNGADVDMGQVLASVESLVTKHMATVPGPKDGEPGKDGHSVSVEDVTPLIQAEVTKAVSAIPVPKDGVGVGGALIDRAGNLVLTLTDGTTKDVGLVVGKDVDPVDIQRVIAEQVEKWPRPKDGKDGVDGLGFEDMEETFDGERTVTRRYSKGDRVVVSTYTLPGVLDRGVYTPEKSYVRGDGVTYGGSFWIAQGETKGVQPGLSTEASRVWRLAVKRGGDGKPGPQGQPGPEGKPGLKGDKGPDRW